MALGRKYIGNCELCGAPLERMARRRVTLALEYGKRVETGNVESNYKAYKHAVICQSCAKKIKDYIEGLKG